MCFKRERRENLSKAWCNAILHDMKSNIPEMAILYRFHQAQQHCLLWFQCRVTSPAPLRTGADNLLNCDVQLTAKMCPHDLEYHYHFVPCVVNMF
jgi:hypothetical protein